MRLIILTMIVCTWYACGPDAGNKKPASMAETKPDTTTTGSTGSKPDSTALNWRELAAWLPEIKGYQPQESTGENTYTGASGSRYHAFARRQYMRNDKQLVIEIIDYNNDPKTFKGLLNMYGFNTPIQNAQMQTRLVETGMPQVKALETKFTENKDIRLTLAVAGRFMIQILEPGGYNEKLPEQIMKAIPLQEIANK